MMIEMIVKRGKIGFSFPDPFPNTMNTNPESPRIADTGFLAGLPADLRDHVARGAQRVAYPAGQSIQSPGSPSSPGVLLQGLARWFVTAADGREATVRYARPGDAIGLAGLYVRDQAVGMQALSETTVLYFEEALFKHTLATNVVLAGAVAETLAGRSQSMLRAIQALAFGRVRERVAAHLLSLSELDGHGRLVARVTQQALADAVGSVRDVAARALRELSTSGAIVTSHGKVVITDEEALGREAHFEL